MLCSVNKEVFGKRKSRMKPPLTPPGPGETITEKHDGKSSRRISKLSFWKLEFPMTYSRLGCNLMFANEDVIYLFFSP